MTPAFDAEACSHEMETRPCPHQSSGGDTRYQSDCRRCHANALRAAYAAGVAAERERVAVFLTSPEAIAATEDEIENNGFDSALRWVEAQLKGAP